MNFTRLIGLFVVLLIVMQPVAALCPTYESIEKDTAKQLYDKELSELTSGEQAGLEAIMIQGYRQAIVDRYAEADQPAVQKHLETIDSSRELNTLLNRDRLEEGFVLREAGVVAEEVTEKTIPESMSSKFVSLEEIIAQFGADPSKIEGEPYDGLHRPEKIELQEKLYVTKKFYAAKNLLMNELAGREIIKAFIPGIQTAEAVGYTDENDDNHLLSEFVPDISPDQEMLKRMTPEQRSALTLLIFFYGTTDARKNNILFDSKEDLFIIDLEYWSADLKSLIKPTGDRTSFHNELKAGRLSIFEKYATENGEEVLQPIAIDDFRQALEIAEQSKNDPLFLTRFREILDDAGFDDEKIEDISQTIESNLNNFDENLRTAIRWYNEFHGFEAEAVPEEEFTLRKSITPPAYGLSIGINPLVLVRGAYDVYQAIKGIGNTLSIDRKLNQIEKGSSAAFTAKREYQQEAALTELVFGRYRTLVKNSETYFGFAREKYIQNLGIDMNSEVETSNLNPILDTLENELGKMNTEEVKEIVFSDKYFNNRELFGPYIAKYFISQEIILWLETNIEKRLNNIKKSELPKGSEALAALSSEISTMTNALERLKDLKVIHLSKRDAIDEKLSDILDPERYGARVYKELDGILYPEINEYTRDNPRMRKVLLDSYETGSYYKNKQSEETIISKLFVQFQDHSHILREHMIEHPSVTLFEKGAFLVNTEIRPDQVHGDIVGYYGIKSEDLKFGYIAYSDEEFKKNAEKYPEKTQASELVYMYVPSKERNKGYGAALLALSALDSIDDLSNKLFIVRSASPATTKMMETMGYSPAGMTGLLEVLPTYVIDISTEKAREATRKKFQNLLDENMEKVEEAETKGFIQKLAEEVAVEIC